MNYTFNMESVLVALTTILCATLVLNLLHKLRLSLPWRVNCWFCNNNFWVKFVERNSWVCPKCEQYNGFTKDGDYNKPLTSMSSDSGNKSPRQPRGFQRSPPKNGLCKMCNVNQQLKVAQLANFVPMNERNFENEIEDYKMQLEKAYKLCSPCRKVLQKKLHKEKEVLLGSKVLETRSPEKRNVKHEKQSSMLKAVINKTSVLIAGVLVLLVIIECYINTKKSDLPSSVMNLKDIVIGVLDRVVCIAKMKFALTFPSLENYSVDFNMYSDMIQAKINLTNLSSFEQANDATQKGLGAFVCLIQIVGHIWNINKLNYTILIDLLWSVFVMVSIANEYVTMEPLYIRLVKLTSVLAVLVVYKNMNAKITNIPAKFQPSPKKIKILQNGASNSFFDDDSDVVMESDDDVSLSKFGLHHFTDSSTDTVSPLSASMLNGRSFTPRVGDSIWSKPKLNTTFCVNSVFSKSPSSVSETVFVKPSFHKYQNLTKDDSDSDLDESISSLCISSPKKASHKSNSIFSLRKFTATPSFVAPAPARPLISPGKLGHGTSWVAGGYWGAEGERALASAGGSRSSSQSSGFESQASSAARAAAGLPPSREASVCGDAPCGFGLQQFAGIGSPVFPPMRCNGPVQPPRPPGPAPPPAASLIDLSRLNSYGAR